MFLGHVIPISTQSITAELSLNLICPRTTVKPQHRADFGLKPNRYTWQLTDEVQLGPSMAMVTCNMMHEHTARAQCIHSKPDTWTNTAERKTCFCTQIHTNKTNCVLMQGWRDIKTCACLHTDFCEDMH